MPSRWGQGPWGRRQRGGRCYDERRCGGSAERGWDRHSVGRDRLPLGRRRVDVPVIVGGPIGMLMDVGPIRGAVDGVVVVPVVVVCTYQHARTYTASL